MRFWDSSALIPLLVEEDTTISIRALLLSDAEVIVWWGTPIECASAVCRLERNGDLSSQAATEALERLGALVPHWHRIKPAEAVLEIAQHLLRAHSLRAADSFQLAAAYLASERRPSTLEFVCLDDRLVSAAQREGFPVRDRSSL